jgi:hypothetical protein
MTRWIHRAALLLGALALVLGQPSPAHRPGRPVGPPVPVVICTDHPPICTV